VIFANKRCRRTKASLSSLIVDCGDLFPVSELPDLRLDSFENVRPLVEQWLNEHPDVTAKSLFHRLQEETPESFGPGQLRILQRRVKEWHSEIARRLVLGADLQSEKEIRAPLAASVRLKMRQFTAGTGFAISLSRA